MVSITLDELTASVRGWIGPRGTRRSHWRAAARHVPAAPDPLKMILLRNDLLKKLQRLASGEIQGKVAHAWDLIRSRSDSRFVRFQINRAMNGDRPNQPKTLR